MTTPIKLNGRGQRGESFADVARRTGSIGGVPVETDATDQEVLDASQAAPASVTMENLWPDTFFRDTGGEPTALDGIYRLYSAVFDNREWDADYLHDYGRGAWLYDGASGAAQGYNTVYAMPGAATYGLTTGDKVSETFRVSCMNGPADVICRLQFFSAATDGGYVFVGDPIAGTYVEGLDDGAEATISIIGATIPATAIGHVAWVDQLSTTTDFAVTAHVCVKGDKAAYLPSIRETDAALARRIKPVVDAAVAEIDADLAGLPGSRVSATDRLATSLTDYGTTKGLDWMPDRLRQTRAKFRTLDHSFTGLCRIALLGDSWTDNTNYFTRMFTEWVTARYGDGGPGWIGFGYQAGPTNYAGNARDIYSVTSTGTSTSDYGGGAVNNSPCLSNWKSSTTGAKVTVTAATVNGKTPTAILATARLYWKATADGVIRYRVNGGSWTTLNVQGTLGTNQSAALSGLPTASAWTMEFEVVSGSVELHGLYAEAAQGVTVSQLAASGAKASDFTAADETQWVASMTQLAFDSFHLLFGTNESVAGVAASTYAAAVTELAERCLAASPGADLLLGVPFQNATVGATSLASYRAALEPVAENKKALLVDYQYAFGETLATYDGTGARSWLNDPNHPRWSDNTGTAVPVLADAVIRVFGGSRGNDRGADGGVVYSRGVTSVRNQGTPAVGWGLKSVSTGAAKNFGAIAGTQDFDAGALTLGSGVVAAALLVGNGTGGATHDLLAAYSNTTSVFRVTDGGDVEIRSKASDSSLSFNMAATSGGGQFEIVITGGTGVDVGSPNNVPLRLKANGTTALTLSNADQSATFAASARIGGSSGPRWVSGTGSPEGVITAPVGSHYSRTDGGAGTSSYTKESGTGNTGWVAK